jgi:uncharacterized protein YgbK (DUF1537 family)
MTGALSAKLPASVSAGIVADDLTGAGDSAVKFAAAGWQARLALGGPFAVALQPGSVVAVVTDSRAQHAEAARLGTSGAVTDLMGSGIDRLFVKIDSTLRGSVPNQIRGALDAWTHRYPDAIAIVCPAYPAMGRTVEGGLLLVDGEGVETTSFGRDPVTPVTTSVLADLVPGSVGIHIRQPNADDLAMLITAAGVSVVTVDARTDDDLAMLAAAIELLGARALPVGSAGLAVQMARVWGSANAPTPFPRKEPIAGRSVVVISSLHDVSRAQYAHLLESCISVQTLAPTLREILAADDAMSSWIAKNLDTETSASVIVILSPTRQDNVSGDDSANDISTRIAAALAAIADAVVSTLGAGSLVLMGGDGARAVLARFEAKSVQITHAIGEGTPIGVIEGGRLHGLTVATKAGGFGSSYTLTDLLPKLLK